MILIDKFKRNYNESLTDIENKIKTIAQKLYISPDWLMYVMYSESGLNSKAVNKQSGDTSDAYSRSAYRATGLIQFMPTTAKELGTTTQALYNMTAIQQLDYVYKYYDKWIKWAKNKGYSVSSYYDLYLLTFFPAAIGKPDNFIFKTSSISASSIAKQNSALDANKDGMITLAEFKSWIKTRVPSNFWEALALISTEKKKL